MVAVIRHGKSIRATLTYNEQKVDRGVADCLEAANYPLSAGIMTFHQKLARLKNLADLNPATKINSVHISLNFDPSEQLSAEQLREIAGSYMAGIGFGDQPYLLYQHYDAGHPHVHIVSTQVRDDGTAIRIHNLAKLKSETVRRAIEADFGLVKAESQKRRIFQLQPADPTVVKYGKSETRAAIHKVLCSILHSYKYGSLSELNAVLNLYNVTADPGSEDSRVRRHGGILYGVLDAKGQRVGMPIKASLLPGNPGLAFLQQKFEGNRQRRQHDKARLRREVGHALKRGPGSSLSMMTELLQRKGIDTVLRVNEDGRWYGVTFVDHHSKAVFKGSDLGEEFSVTGIAAYLEQVRQTSGNGSGLNREPAHQAPEPEAFLPLQYEFPLLETLLCAEQAPAYVPAHFRKKKKRKKKAIR